MKKFMILSLAGIASIIFDSNAMKYEKYTTPISHNFALNQPITPKTLIEVGYKKILDIIPKADHERFIENISQIISLKNLINLAQYPLKDPNKEDFLSQAPQEFVQNTVSKSSKVVGNSFFDPYVALNAEDIYLLIAFAAYRNLTQEEVDRLYYIYYRGQNQGKYYPFKEAQIKIPDSIK